MGSEPGNFREPHDIFVGGSNGYVYVADRQNNRVQVFEMSDTGTSASGIAADGQGNIYAADVGLNNLRKYVKVQ